MTEPRWLTRAMILAMQNESIAAFGGLPGVRDEGLLDSAIARPKNAFFDQEESTLTVLAAAYGFGLARNHGFLDGNKRISAVSIAVFLRLNGRRFAPSNVDTVHAIRALAAGELDESGLAVWIEANCV